MVSYLNRLECLIEKWQSRRKTIEISQKVKGPAESKSRGKQSNSSSSNNNNNSNSNNKEGRTTKVKHLNIDSSNRNNPKRREQVPLNDSQEAQDERYNCGGGNGNNIFATNMKLEARITSAASNRRMVDAQGGQPQESSSGSGSDPGGCVVGLEAGDIESSRAAASDAADAADTTDTTTARYTTFTTTTTTTTKPSIMMMKHHRPQTPPKTSLVCMLSLSSLLLFVGLLHYSLLSQLTTATSPPLTIGASSARQSRDIQRQQQQQHSSYEMAARQFGQLGLDLVQRLTSATSGQPSRWIRVPGPQHSIRDPANRRQTPLNRVLSRLRNQIGARNTIRVHNAFRDFAWRLLSSLSMPTPVIYELRRQHFYSPEDDLMNDSFFDKNTTRTIRSKRQLLKFWPPPTTAAVHLDNELDSHKKRRRASDDDDDDDSLRSRVRDLFSASPRGGGGLVGRMIRLPALFPFKRQEETDDDFKAQRPGASGRGGWRRWRKKENDRQMISINGKQYYVNDEGELKELNEKSDQ